MRERAVPECLRSRVGCPDCPTCASPLRPVPVLPPGPARSR
ncbi:hypothetical protein [Streptomyces sp. NPDC096033]